ncbi:MAG: hypothetical protein AB7N76_03285 [Planctomycetota bacterium]
MPRDLPRPLLLALCGLALLSLARADVSVESTPEGRAGLTARAFMDADVVGLFRCLGTKDGAYRLEPVEVVVGGVQAPLTVPVATVGVFHKGQQRGERPVELSDGKVYALCLTKQDAKQGAGLELGRRGFFDGYLSQVKPEDLGILPRGGKRVDDPQRDELWGVLRTLAPLRASDAKPAARCAALALLCQFADREDDLAKPALAGLEALPAPQRAEVVLAAIREDDGRAFAKRFGVRDRRLERYFGWRLARICVEDELAAALPLAERTLAALRDPAAQVPATQARAQHAAWVVAALGKGEPQAAAIRLLTSRLAVESERLPEMLAKVSAPAVDEALRALLAPGPPATLGRAEQRAITGAARALECSALRKSLVAADVKLLIPWVARAGQPHNAGYTDPAYRAVPLLEALTGERHGVHGAMVTYRKWGEWWDATGSHDPRFR